MQRSAQFGRQRRRYCGSSDSRPHQQTIPRLSARPFRGLRLAELSVSDDEFHDAGVTCAGQSPARLAQLAAAELGIPCAGICIEKPCIEKPRTAQPDAAARKGQPVARGPVLFKGRAAEKFVEGLPVRPAAGMTTCPHEDLASPERVHVDAYGRVHLCQGIRMGSLWTATLSALVRDYNPAEHPLAGPLLRVGPAQLARDFGVDASGRFVDECHLCYTVRKSLAPRFPEWLGPPQVYGIEPCRNWR